MKNCDTAAQKSEEIKQLFASVAQRYDRANQVLSLGRDRMWRRRLVQAVKNTTSPNVILDLATGSGDVALALNKAMGTHVRVIGMDFCPSMLDEARKKQIHVPTRDRITFSLGDCHELAFADNSIDVITIAFGLRNLTDRMWGLREMHRVLKSGGILFILEFSQPYRWFRPFYWSYLNLVLPSLARWLTRTSAPYDHLIGSIQSFSGRKALAAEIRSAGFKKVSTLPLTFGIVALHRATA